jgi:hypothetical protein
MDRPPLWVMDLVMRLDRYEETHPSNCQCSGQPDRGVCLEDMLNMVPADVLTHARVIAAYLTDRKGAEA